MRRLAVSALPGLIASGVGWLAGDPRPKSAECCGAWSWCSNRTGTHALRLMAVATPRSDLPGSEIVEDGLRDLDQGRCTIPALVVSIGAPRLRLLGMEVASPNPDAEHALYRLLAEDDPDAAHGRYNALVRRLVSFERSVACAG